jgi:hypothetical protein
MTTRRMSKTPIPLTRSLLANVRIRALRRGLWFKVLNRLERAGVDLTLKVVDKVRSSVLTKMLTSIVAKLSEALESRVARTMREVGYTLAQQLSRIAQEWGNKSAAKWKADHGFVQYLAVMCLNNSPMFNG